MQEYIYNGVKLGWLIEPAAKTVEIYRISKQTEVAIATLKYLKFAKNNNERPVLFNYVPHVFYQGRIDVSEVEIVNY